MRRMLGALAIFVGTLSATSGAAELGSCGPAIGNPACSNRLRLQIDEGSFKGRVCIEGIGEASGALLCPGRDYKLSLGSSYTDTVFNVSEDGKTLNIKSDGGTFCVARPPGTLRLDTVAVEISTGAAPEYTCPPEGCKPLNTRISLVKGATYQLFEDGNTHECSRDGTNPCWFKVNKAGQLTSLAGGPLPGNSVIVNGHRYGLTVVSDDHRCAKGK